MKPRTVYLDLTHLGRHVTGIERVAIEQFEKVRFEGATLKPVRARGLVSMIFKQQIVLPLLALAHPRAVFVFPGFPPSVLFRFARERTVLYVHDAFLITRPADLSRKAKLYMARPFKAAVSGLRYFLTNSEKTRAELQPFAARDAAIELYRPAVSNVFALDGATRSATREAGAPLRLVALGTVEPRKNYMAAAAILDAVRAAGHPDAELHIVGRAGWGQDAQALAAHPGVTIHGYLAARDVKAIIEGADVYLCTSHDEGLGLPLIEAQYAGLPVAAPDAPVFREVLGTSGWFIDPNDAPAAARLILERLKAGDVRSQARDLALANTVRWNALAAGDLAHVRGLFAGPLRQGMASLHAHAT